MNNSKKKDNFVKNLKEFLIIYQDIVNKKTLSLVDSALCANKARQTAEAFCKTIINQHIEVTGAGSGSLYNLIQEIKTSDYINDTYKKRSMVERLDRVRVIGNNASHNNQHKPSIYDLKEIKNNLLYLSTSILSEEEILNIEQMYLSHKKKHINYILLPIILLLILTTLFLQNHNDEKQELQLSGNNNKVIQKRAQERENQIIKIDGSGNQITQETKQLQFQKESFCQEGSKLYHESINELNRELSNSKQEIIKKKIIEDIKIANKQLNNFQKNNCLKGKK